MHYCFIVLHYCFIVFYYALPCRPPFSLLCTTYVASSAAGGEGVVSLVMRL